MTSSTLDVKHEWHNPFMLFLIKCTLNFLNEICIFGRAFLGNNPQIAHTKGLWSVRQSEDNKIPHVPILLDFCLVSIKDSRRNHQ